MDNGSVYTKNLIDFLTQKKIEFISQNFDQVNLSDIPNYNSFILSGRRKNDKQMNALNSKIIQHAVSEKKSLLGICYGAEILALTIGGTIRKKDSLEKGNEEIIILQNNPLCHGKSTVFESHSYEISRISDRLVNLAHSKSCTYELIQVKNLNIFGTQFHPEMSSDGKSMIQAFVSL